MDRPALFRTRRTSFTSPHYREQSKPNSNNWRWSLMTTCLTHLSEECLQVLLTIVVLAVGHIHCSPAVAMRTLRGREGGREGEGEGREGGRERKFQQTLQTASRMVMANKQCPPWVDSLLLLLFLLPSLGRVTQTLVYHSYHCGPSQVLAGRGLGRRTQCRHRYWLFRTFPLSS